MKNKFMIACITLLSLSLMAFTYVNLNYTVPESKAGTCLKSDLITTLLPTCKNSKQSIDLVYKLDHRFNTTITMEQLSTAESILDIVPYHAYIKGDKFKQVKIVHLSDQGDIEAFNSNKILSDEQKELLKSMDYTSSFYIHAQHERDNPSEHNPDEDLLVYYISVAPAHPAQYTGGSIAVENYVRKHLRNHTPMMEKDQLKPGKVGFLVTKEGRISDVKLEYTCGYPSADKALHDAIESLPGHWQAARDGQGNTVDQSLMFFFGLIGC